jgi:hypothetical protein
VVAELGEGEEASGCGGAAAAAPTIRTEVPFECGRPLSRGRDATAVLQQHRLVIHRTWSKRNTAVCRLPQVHRDNRETVRVVQQLPPKSLYSNLLNTGCDYLDT